MVEFWLGTFADPIYRGDWPESVKSRIPFIPKITPELVRPRPHPCASCTFLDRTARVAPSCLLYLHCISQELR